MRPTRHLLALATALATVVAPSAAGAQTFAYGGGTVTLFVQHLQFPATPISTFEYPTDLGFFRYGALDGSSPFSLGATTRATAYVTGGGCGAADFDTFFEGWIALVDRGAGCDFDVSYENAQAAGAAGLVFINNVATPPIVMEGSPGVDDPTIPVFMLSQTAGNAIRDVYLQERFAPVMTLSLAYTPTVVPEPATIALTGGGLLLLAAVGARRRARG
jgi:hypothetical protein